MPSFRAIRWFRASLPVLASGPLPPFGLLLPDCSRPGIAGAFTDAGLPPGQVVFYTAFAYEGAALSSPELRPGGSLEIRVTLRNTGSRPGTEVAQLYVRDLVGSVTRPVRELRGFQRVSLAPGESRELRFTLRPADLAFHHEDLRFAPEAGAFEVFVGGSSEAPKAGSFTYVE